MQVLDKTGLKPKDVDALITNCCTFNPVPSLSAAVVNHFKMKQSIITYHLGGMGCAASVIAMDIAQELLKVCPAPANGGMQSRFQYAECARCAASHCLAYVVHELQRRLLPG